MTDIYTGGAAAVLEMPAGDIDWDAVDRCADRSKWSQHDSVDQTTLATIHFRLLDSAADVKKATNACKGIFVGGDPVALRAARDEAVARHDANLDLYWDTLRYLPRGTNCPGGATPQTVALQHFNGNLDKNLVKNLSASDAKKINTRSFIR